MSTRGIYQFTDGNESFCVYKHCDNYPEGPHGGFAAIAKAGALSWKLPRFEPDEFAASFVAANKDGSGGVRLTQGGAWHAAASLDCEYAYIIGMGANHREPVVQCFAIQSDYDTGEWTATSVYCHSLAKVIEGWRPSEERAA
jgi:hypothetical protein